MPTIVNIFPVTILACYLVVFYWGGSIASQGAGRSIWLVGQTKGVQYFVELGFRTAFVLALLGPLLLVFVPSLQVVDPLWQTESSLGLALTGVALSSLGAMVAFAAQMSMGASWRVGVMSGETGVLVSGGLFNWSRNPTFVGHFILLLGVAVAVPSLVTLFAVLTYFASIGYQVRKEEQALREMHGEEFIAYCEKVPRWIRVARR